MTTVLVTTGRADFTSVAALCIELAETANHEWCLWVTGDHDESTILDWAGSIRVDYRRIRFGPTWHRGENTEMPLEWLGDFTTWIGKSIESLGPSLMVLVGDRSELLPVASAALTREIPIAHFSGGDLTLGSTDNLVRFALSVMANYHFVSNEEHAKRLIALGESPRRVFLSGEPALSLIPKSPQYSKSFFLDKYELSDVEEFALLTYHPAARLSSDLEIELSAIFTSLESYVGGLLITASNADMRANIVNSRLRDFAQAREHTTIVNALGPIFYYEAMHHAQFMIGNSSSGLWEAPTIGLPVINVGDRQKGRLRGSNVIDVGGEVPEIRDAIKTVMLRGHAPESNPYGTNDSAKIAVKFLAVAKNDTFTIQKDFSGKLVSNLNED